LTVQAFAKINLALDVLHKREDGYHEVEMVMQSISLADTLTISSRQNGITISTNISDLETDSRNLAYRAAALLQERFGISEGVHIHIEKEIPIAAGLAGGSSDAAAVLKGLNSLWALGLTQQDMANLGAALGSDVPFCVYGGTMLATGRGELLSPLPQLPECWVILAKPPVDVSTAWVYGNFKAERVINRPDLNSMRRVLANRDLQGVAGNLANVLETVTEPAYPEISHLKTTMKTCGALASLMSGSGPTVFGLTSDYTKACEIADKIADSSNARIMLAKTL